jgi:hypothetical protein
MTGTISCGLGLSCGLERCSPSRIRSEPSRRLGHSRLADGALGRRQRPPLRPPPSRTIPAAAALRSPAISSQRGSETLKKISALSALFALNSTTTSTARGASVDHMN